MWIKQVYYWHNGSTNAHNWNLAENFCWSFISSLKAPILSANRILLEEKVGNVLICQDSTVWVSHKLKFALYWKPLFQVFFHSELERKAACYLFVLTHKLILTVTTWNDIVIAYVTRMVTVVMKPTVWLSKYLGSWYHFMINLDATSLNICWKPCLFVRLLHAIPFSLSNGRSTMWRLLTQWTYKDVFLVIWH